MISAKANSDVNAIQYEDPYGKLKYLDLDLLIYLMIRLQAITIQISLINKMIFPNIY
jgi:hypothetical protein